MNAKQKRKAKAILAKDCKTRHVYLDSLGNTCAVGCLALAAGATKEQLAFAGGGRIGSCDRVITRIRRLIWEAFGLKLHELKEIQAANDRCWTTAQRRRVVLAKLEEL